jgi:hypothetical protein
LWVLGLAAGRPLQAQVVDAGTLFISSGNEIVGREEFTVRRGQRAGPGFTITTTAWYPPTRAQRTVSVELELGPDSLPAAFQFQISGADPFRLFGILGTRRVTVRLVRPGREAARELPGAARHVVTDDSVFALQALLPRTGGPDFTAFTPRQDRRAAAQVTGGAEERTPVAGVWRTLQRVTLRLNGRERHLWYDPAGRLMKVEDSTLGLVAERTDTRP